PASKRAATGVSSSTGKGSCSRKNRFARSRSLTATVATTIASASMRSPRQGVAIMVPPMDAPSDAQDDAFGALVEAAIAALPVEFRERLDSVAIVVEDEPTAEQLASVGAGGWFGLYQGVPRPPWGADAAALPSKISVFRGPLERAYRDPALLAAAV